MTTIIRTFFLAIFLSSAFIYPEEPLKSVETVYYLNEYRRPFNWYSPYPYQYYYQRRDGSDGCGWRYTSRGLEYSCS